jgi:PAS domain S-box-containing protein
MTKTKKEKKPFCAMLNPTTCKDCGQMCDALDHIIKSMPDTVFYRRNLVSDTYDYVCPTCQQIFGIAPQEFCKMKIAEVREHIIHPDDRLRLQDSITHLFLNNGDNENTKVAIEYRIKCRDGNYRWISDLIGVCSDEKGVPVAMIGCARDISETVRLRDALAICEQRFNNLYNYAKVALFCGSTNDGRLLECNELFAWCLGFHSPQECKESFSFDKNIVDPNDYDKFIRDIRDSKVLHNREIRLRRKDGGSCWMSNSIFLCDTDYFDAVACDITALKVLTESEVGVLKLLLAGLSNKEIAARLKRSRRTVEQHRASIMQKLNAKNIVDLAMHYLIMMF